MPGGAVDLGTLLVRLSAENGDFIKGLNTAVTHSKLSFDSILRSVFNWKTITVSSFAAVGAAAVKMTLSLEKATREAGQRMGETSLAMQREMSLMARRLAKEGEFSVNELSAAYKDLAAAGYDARQSISALSQVEMTARAHAMSLGQATSSLTRVQTAFGLVSRDAAKNAANLTQISDLLTMAQKNSRASFEDLAGALSGSMAVALRDMGVSLKDAVSLFAAWADQGVKGGEATSRLILIVNSLQRAAKQNSLEFQRLGIDIFDTQGKLLPLEKILTQISTRFENLSDAEKQAAFETLGFSGRIIPMVSSLVNASKGMAQYRQTLEDVAGATKDRAAKTTDDFQETLANLNNQVKELSFQLGDELKPAIQATIEALKDAFTASDDLRSLWEVFRENIGPAVVTAIGLIGDAIRGWMMIGKSAKILFADVLAGILQIFSDASKSLNIIIEFIVNGLVGGVNMAIRQINKLLPQAAKLGEIDFHLDFGSDDNLAGEWSKKLLAIRDEAAKDMVKLANEPSFTDRLIDSYGNVLEKRSKKLIKDMAEGLGDGVKGAFGEAAAEAANELTKLQRDTQYALRVLQQLEDPLLKDPSGRNRHGMGDEDVNQAYQLNEEKKIAEQRLAVLEELNKQELELSEEAQRKKIELLEAYRDKVAALTIAQTQLVLSASESMSESLTSIAKDLAGEQAGIYKGMFAVTKAFAIAEATVAIYQGIANAASEKFPANLVAMAKVAAATSSIVSNIQQTQLAFGGGKAAGGNIEPGYFYRVNEYGQEEIAPNFRSKIIPAQSEEETPTPAPQSSPVRVIINNYSDATATATEKMSGDERIVEVVVKKVEATIASGIRAGSGSIPKAMENSYNLRRGAR